MKVKSWLIKIIWSLQQIRHYSSIPSNIIYSFNKIITISIIIIIINCVAGNIKLKMLEGLKGKMIKLENNMEIEMAKQSFPF